MGGIKSLSRWVVTAAVIGLIVGMLGMIPKNVHAEGTNQFNEKQGLTSSTVLYADVLTVGEAIKISVCNNTSISIWNTNATPSNLLDDTQVVTSSAFTANLSCSSSLPNPITGAYSYVPSAIGTYRIQFTGTQSRYDFSVTANNATNPNPTIASGRIWSYRWNMSTGSFAQAEATNADLFILVPAPVNGQNFVWKLDLNNFSGNVYSLAANRLGLDPPYSGISASGGSSSVTPEYPIYLGYPAIAGTASVTVPSISAEQFIDDANEDSIFSPSTTPGVQDTGNFKFTNNVDNANYAITIDTNQDGVYGTGDRLLLGYATNGVNTVNWDGNYPNGSPVPAGVYTAQIQIRTGEYHFIANDVETSGGTTNAGTTWTNGLTIYRALDANTTENTRVYWDDLTELGSEADATANVPSGVISGSTADANSDGKADGFHTWGNFTGTTLGNNNNIDTYVYGPTATKIVTLAVANSESGDADGVTANTEIGAPNNGDGNNDGIEDFLQDNVSSLPNPILNGAYTTISASGCTTNSLSSVSIFAEADLSKADTVYNYPVGLSDFTINCLNPGDTTNVTIYYDKTYDTSKWVARKFIDGAYTNISGAIFGTSVIGGQTVTTLSYSVTDGGSGDADGIANGIIVDPAGPGILGTSNSATSTTPNNPAVPNTGLAWQSQGISYVLLIGSGLLYATYEIRQKYTKRKNLSTDI